MKLVMLIILLHILAFAGLLHGQPGFISIDCGLSDYANYTEDTGINYVSDAGFIDSGVNQALPVDNVTLNTLLRHVQTVWSFPNGGRNCYTLKPVIKGNKYLIRASFLYGNYDGLNQVPQFDLYIGVNRWSAIYNASQATFYEIITVAQMEYALVCLVNTGNGTPFISALELRPLKNTMYPASNENQSLQLYNRIDAGLQGRDNIRYPQDPFDLIWKSMKAAFWSNFNTSLAVQCLHEDFQPPPAVMMTAVRPFGTGDTLYFSWSPNDPPCNIMFTDTLLSLSSCSQTKPENSHCAVVAAATTLTDQNTFLHQLSSQLFH